jgi:hypothetical protein
MNVTVRTVFVSGPQRSVVIRCRMLVCDGACSWDECKEALYLVTVNSSDVHMTLYGAVGRDVITTRDG